MLPLPTGNVVLPVSVPNHLLIGPTTIPLVRVIVPLTVGLVPTVSRFVAEVLMLPDVRVSVELNEIGLFRVTPAPGALLMVSPKTLAVGEVAALRMVPVPLILCATGLATCVKVNVAGFTSPALITSADPAAVLIVIMAPAFTDRSRCTLVSVGALNSLLNIVRF